MSDDLKEIVVGIVAVKVFVITFYIACSTVFFLSGMLDATRGDKASKTGCYKKTYRRIEAIFPAYKLGCHLSEEIEIDE